MNAHWDNAHVVTCNRDRWQFERQIILLNALDYPGVLRVYVNEYEEACSSWHVWFKNVYRECNRIFRRSVWTRMFILCQSDDMDKQKRMDA